MIDLSALRDRVRAATGPDRKLDTEIKLAMAGIAIHGGMDADETRKQFGGLYDDPPCYTASIDAAVALVERVLPGTTGDLDFGPWCESGRSGCRLFVPGRDPSWINDAGEAATPPLAIIAALLSALDAGRTE